MKNAGRFGLLAALAAAALLCASPGYAVPIYEGDLAATARILLGGWGSGTATETRERVFGGHPAAIRITTDGFYSGGRIYFSQPKDLTREFARPNWRLGFLEFIVQFAGGPGAGGPVFGGGFSPYGGFGGEAQPAAQQGSRYLRAVLIFEDGVVEVTNHPIALQPATNDATWFSMPIPFVAFKGIDRLRSFRLREIRLFTDRKDEFYVGEIRTAIDEEPISVEPLENLEVAVGDTVQFTATAAAGLSALHYSWDFNKDDGIQEDATGQSVTHTFRKQSPQNPDGSLRPYIVTLTVSDVHRVKKPEVRTAEIVVNP